MTKHVTEALFIALFFLALVPLATRRDHAVAAAVISGLASFVGFLFVLNGS